MLERIAAEPELVTPTGIAIDRRGRLLVIESHTHFPPAGYKGPKADRILLFADRDGDGRPEPAGVFFEGTRWTMSVAVAPDESIYVATRSALYRLEDRDGDGRADGITPGTIPEPIVRLDSTGDYPHNGLSGFAFSAAGDVYFGLGENLGVPYKLIGSDGKTLTGGGEGGNVYRCRPDGRGLERLATGFWNPFNLTFDSAGNLFAVDNDPDSRPPCRLLHIVDGGDYGYRFRNGRRGIHPFTAWNGELPGTLGMVAGTGEAPCAVIQYSGSNLPAEYRGALLVTSWGDHRLERYDLEPHGATFRASMKPVVVGGDDFRPVGLAVAPDGSIYFSDWVDQSYTLHGKGRLWRLRRKPDSAHVKENPPAGPLPDRSHDAIARAESLRRTADPAAVPRLLESLESNDPFLRQAARRGLERSLKPAQLAEMARKPDLSTARRLGLLLVLRDLDAPEGRDLLPGDLDDPDPTVRFSAIQWIGEHRIEAYRNRLMAGLGSGSTTPEVFQATLASLEMLDNRRRDSRDELAGEDYIVGLLKDAHTPPAIVARCLRMLRPDHPALSPSLFDRLLDSADARVCIEAIRSLPQGTQSQRFTTLARLAYDRSLEADLRAAAIDGLAWDAADQRERLLDLAGSGPSMLRREALRGLRSLKLDDRDTRWLRWSNQGDPVALALIDRIGAAPPASGSAELTANLDRWQKLLDGPADPAVGERVFFHATGPGCYRCHQVDGRGGRVGPDLSTIASAGDRRRLLESILAPSREIAP
ncbi:MAG: PVC-type heme-binding CxxCH protein, partial [Isosphaeraceae bacterium]